MCALTMSAQRCDAFQGARAAWHVSQLSLPKQPSRDTALWTIASCDVLRRRSAAECKITTKSIREACAAAKEAVEETTAFLDMLRAQRPLSAAEEALLQPMHASARCKFPFALNFAIQLQLEVDLVRVGPSPTHGHGVFAATNIPKHTFITTYPVDILELREDAATKCRRHAVKTERRHNILLFSREGAHQDVQAHMRMKQEYSDYALEISNGVVVYADPTKYSPGACGHKINDPRGASPYANCVECPLGGGIVIAILTTREVKEGEELFLHYGESYWDARAKDRERGASLSTALA